MYEIIFYEDKNKRSEIKEYIKSLQENKNKSNNIKFNKIISYMRWLQEKGLNIGEPYIKYLNNDIWELRPLRDRILFAYCDNNKFILLSIFVKQTKKTPVKEILKAQRLLEDYKKRSEWIWKKGLQLGMSLKRL